MSNLKKNLHLLFFGTIVLGMLGMSLSPNTMINTRVPNINISNNKPNAALIPHAPIYIDGNTSLDTFCTVGDGSFVNPYIIENYSIAATSSHGIEIKNTDAYLVIRNCVIENGSSTYHGIVLHTCYNVRISNNDVNNNKVGISLTTLKNSTILNNTVSTNSQDGIILDSSSNSNTISINRVDRNDFGIRLFLNSNNNTISGNNCSWNYQSGFSLSYSYNNTVIDNIGNKNVFYGIKISTASFNIIWKNDFVENKVLNAHSTSTSVNSWDNGTHGNFWGDYLSRYPNATNDGLKWSIPYQINDSIADTDRYPIVQPFNTTITTSTSTTSTTTSTTSSTNTTSGSGSNSTSSASEDSMIDGLNVPLMLISGILVSVFLLHKKKRTILLANKSL
jgi:parallel beta-helix repeat protein